MSVTVALAVSIEEGRKRLVGSGSMRVLVMKVDGAAGSGDIYVDGVSAAVDAASEFATVAVVVESGGDGELGKTGGADGMMGSGRLEAGGEDGLAVVDAGMGTADGESAAPLCWYTFSELMVQYAF